MIRNERGDTIIEVLLATVVISVVIAGAYALTNRATRINQIALERTTASNILRGQIELVRGARTAGAETPVWGAILARASSASPDYSGCNPSANAFYVNGPASGFNFNNTGAIVAYSNPTAVNFGEFFRVWIDPYRPSAAAGYIDFHVRACWEGIGGGQDQTASLVMRVAE